MNMSENQEPTYLWTANDWSNIITIGASAIASVLLVLFKSRCKTINLCFGLINCIRDPQDLSDDEEEENKVLEKEQEETPTEGLENETPNIKESILPVKPLKIEEIKIEST